ncbi:hypothetical protein HAX54_017893 [Datura stramonium]|uniref:Uncharacterized protein n=1 Tax=Datura stramonium TaxID=4076 RepID=A0ABS8UM56_DATST|nr:hypothetical protein [Datura stramonium]
MPEWSAQQTYKVDRSLADPLLPIRVGLTQKYSKKEWNHWRVVFAQYRPSPLQNRHFAPLFTIPRKSGSYLIGDERQIKDQGLYDRRKRRGVVERKRTTSILGAEVYEEWLFGPFRPVVRTSSFMSKTRVRVPIGRLSISPRSPTPIKAGGRNALLIFLTARYRSARSPLRLLPFKGRPSERSFRGLVSDPSFFPKLSESDRSEQEIEESSLIDVN